MTPNRLTAGALLGLLAGCVPGIAVPLPEVPEGSSLLFAQRSGSTVHATFLDEGLTSRAVLPDEAWLGVYPFPPRALDLEAGFDLADLPQAGSQPLPEPTTTWAVANLGAEWAEVPATDAPWGDLHVPQITAEHCAERGGCISEDDPWRCNLDCEVDDPAPAALPIFACPAGWAPVEGPPNSGVTPCLPEHRPSAIECPDGAMLGPAEATCRPIVPCPTEPGWPPAPPGVVRYVSPEAAAGGDGSLANPWRDLATATGQAPDGAAILLADGVYTVAGLVRGRALRLIGRCPQLARVETTEVALRCEDAQVTLTGIRLATSSADAPAAQLSRCTSALEGVELAAAATAVQVTGGRLDMSTVRSRAAVGVNSEGAAITVSDWDHRGGGLLATGGTVELTGARLSGPVDQDGVALVEVPTATVSGLDVDGLGGTIVRTTGVFRHVVVRDVVVRAPTASGLRGELAAASETAPRPRLDIARFALLEVQAGLSVRGMQVRGEDVVLLSRGGAINAEPLEPWPVDLELRRLWVTSDGSTTINLENGEQTGITSTIEGEDWLVVPRVGTGPTHAIHARADTVLRLHRAYLVSGTTSAYYSRCAESHLEDITVVAEGGTGMVIHAANPSEFERIRFEGGFTAGLTVAVADVDCLRAGSTFKDVLFPACSNCQTAVRVLTGVEMVGERFKILDHQVGLEVEGEGDAHLTRSTVMGNTVGLQLPSQRLVEHVVRGVRLDNQRNIAFSSP